jgi:hypothetical protein
VLAGDATVTMLMTMHYNVVRLWHIVGMVTTLYILSCIVFNVEGIGFQMWVPLADLLVLRANWFELLQQTPTSFKNLRLMKMLSEIPDNPID